MSNLKKDELIGYAEFSRRVGKSPQYIAKIKNTGKLDLAIEKKTNKIWHRKGCEILKLDPDVKPGVSRHQNEQALARNKKLQLNGKSNVVEPNKNLKSTAPKQKRIKKSDIDMPEDKWDLALASIVELINNDKLPPAVAITKIQGVLDVTKSEPQDLFQQIQDAMTNPHQDFDYVKLNSLENKTKILKTFYAAEKEKLAYEKELGNLFDRESIERIMTFSFNAIRNTLLNLANNYAVNLEGLAKKDIKDYVEEDINKVLETLQNIRGELDVE